MASKKNFIFIEYCSNKNRLTIIEHIFYYT